MQEVREPINLSDYDNRRKPTVEHEELAEVLSFADRDFAISPEDEADLTGISRIIGATAVEKAANTNEVYEAAIIASDAVDTYIIPFFKKAAKDKLYAAEEADGLDERNALIQESFELESETEWISIVAKDMALAGHDTAAIRSDILETLAGSHPAIYSQICRSLDARAQ